MPITFVIPPSAIVIGIGVGRVESKLNFLRWTKGHPERQRVAPLKPP